MGVDWRSVRVPHFAAVLGAVRVLEPHLGRQTCWLWTRTLKRTRRIITSDPVYRAQADQVDRRRRAAARKASYVAAERVRTKLLGVEGMSTTTVKLHGVETEVIDSPVLVVFGDWTPGKRGHHAKYHPPAAGIGFRRALHRTLGPGARVCVQRERFTSKTNPQTCAVARQAGAQDDRLVPDPRWAKRKPVKDEVREFVDAAVEDVLRPIVTEKLKELEAEFRKSHPKIRPGEALYPKTMRWLKREARRYAEGQKKIIRTVSAAARKAKKQELLDLPSGDPRKIKMVRPHGLKVTDGNALNICSPDCYCRQALAKGEDRYGREMTWKYVVEEVKDGDGMVIKVKRFLKAIFADRDHAANLNMATRIEAMMHAAVRSSTYKNHWAMKPGEKTVKVSLALKFELPLPLVARSNRHLRFVTRGDRKMAASDRAIPEPLFALVASPNSSHTTPTTHSS